MLTTLRNQKGFTLVEMAIVLIIIGLLLGGVLKGQELIDNAKAKKTVNELNSVSVAFNGYQDRYGKIPGDDGPAATLTARGGVWTTVTAGGNNGVLTVAPGAAFTAGGEATAFWQHVRAAGFITGNPATAGLAAFPVNSFQGLIGVANNTTAVTGMELGISVCMSEIPGKIAAQIETQLDDRVPNTGSVRATLGVAGLNTPPGAAAATINETLVYTVCRKL